MRTTLEIDDDVLLAAKELAAKDKTTAGKIISEVFRRGMRSPTSANSFGGNANVIVKNGVPVLPSRGDLITTDHVQRLMENEGI